MGRRPKQDTPSDDGAEVVSLRASSDLSHLFGARIHVAGEDVAVDDEGRALGLTDAQSSILLAQGYWSAL